jgi:hypothetical protein
VTALLTTPNGGAGIYGENCVQGHTALIYDRGGRNRWRQLVDLSAVRWGRTRDAFSDAEITIAGRSCAAQGDTITGIQPRRHELVIWRGSERVYEWPIREVATYRDRAVIRANDIGAYLDATPLTDDYDWQVGEPVPGLESALMTERVRFILDRELTVPYTMTVGTGGAATVVTVPRWENLDPAINVLAHADIRRSSTLYTRSSTLAFEMTLGEHLANLAEGGLDFTTVGRRLVVWDSAIALGRTRVLTDADFDGELEIILAGGDHFSVSHTSAQRDANEGDAPGEDPPSVGNAGGEDPYYGVWTNITSLSSEDGSDSPTQDALNSQAQRDLVGLTPAPLEIRVPEGSTLRTSSTLGINALVPGVIMPVRAELNVRRVQQDQRLDAVSVTETAADGEVIKVTLSSVGAVAVV